MALLTQKQLEDIMLNVHVCDEDWFEDLLLKWNDRQTTQQIEIDWSAAPKYAVMAAINLAWLTENESWTLGYRLATYDRPAVTPHPHAEIMMKYAKVAARRVDPWVEFEGRCESKNWTKCCGFNGFHPDFEYRHIGDDK